MARSLADARPEGHQPLDPARTEPDGAGPAGRIEAPGATPAPMPRFEAFRLDTANEYLWRGETALELPPRVFAVLRYLVEHPNRLVTHRELLDALWPETYVQPEILKTYIRDIRRVLGDDPRAPRFIETRARRGYQFIAAVTADGRRGTGTSLPTPGPAAATHSAAPPPPWRTRLAPGRAGSPAGRLRAAVRAVRLVPGEPVPAPA